MKQNLVFKGRWSDLFGDYLVFFILTAVTFGIYMPWGLARLRRRILENTLYRDQPLSFDGTGGQLFGIALKALLLTIITLGFYALLGFPVVAFLKWDAEHTILPNGKRLEYRGSALGFFGQMLVAMLLTCITFGIYAFWAYPRIRRHVLSNTYLDGQALEFTGTGGQYLGIMLVNVLLSCITLGIYALVGAADVRVLRWDYAHVLVPYQPEETPGVFSVGGRPIQVTVNVNQ